MQLSRVHQLLLRTLFLNLERYGHVRVSDLKRAFQYAHQARNALAAPPTPVSLARTLGDLRAWGLVDSSGFRLTLPGLAVAVALGKPRKAVAHSAALGRNKHKPAQCAA